MFGTRAVWSAGMGSLRADESVEGIAGARDDLARGGDGDRVGRIVVGGIEVAVVVALRIERQDVLPADAELEAQVAGGLPGVLDEDFGLGEAEVADGVGAGFLIALEVAEQGVGERVAGGVGVVGWC